MNLRRGRKIFSLNYLFASFFGALMIAGAFAYYNYKFSQYNFIDFKEWVFYEKRDIFHPKEDSYLFLVYSSKLNDFKELKKKILDKTHTILALDIYQNRFQKKDNVIHITAGINTILKVLRRFNIYEVPSIFLIKKVNSELYKQDSKVTVF